MKKIVLVLAVLMLAVPVMAVVRIDANQVGSTNEVLVRYTATDGNIPRAFALEVTISEPNDSNLVPYRIDPNFYVGFGTPFNYNEGTGVVTWGDQFDDKTPSSFTTEMGSLYKGDVGGIGGPNQPKTSGILFSFKVDHTCDVTLAENAARGGVVVENTTVTPTVALYGCHVALGAPQVAVPNVVGMTQADATTALTTATLIAGTITTANSDTMPTGRIISSTPPATTMVDSGSAVALLKSTGPACKGDINADSKVNSTDVLAIANKIATYGTGTPKRVTYGDAQYDSRADANLDEKINSTDVLKIANWIATYGTGTPKRVNCPHSYN